MRKILSNVVGAAGFVVIGLAIAGCGPKGASLPGTGGSNDAMKNASAAAHKAADQFVALAHGSETSGQPPRQTDPAAGPLLDTIFNTSVLHAGPVPSMSQIDPVNDWLLSVVKVGQVYMLAGTGVTDLTQAASNAAVGAQVERNVVTYAPEFGRYIDAQLSVMDEEAVVINKELASNPGLATANADTTQGLAKVRSGVSETLSSVLVTLATQGLTPDWQRARMTGLLAVAPDAARLILPADKAKLHDTALQVAAAVTDPGVKAQLTNFADVISR